MTKIKFCGLRRAEDIGFANELLPDLIGFVFAEKSKRYVSPKEAALLKEQLDPRIRAVGVFVDAPVEQVIELLRSDVIDLAQLHGNESEEYMGKIRRATEKPIIKAFRIAEEKDLAPVSNCSADFVLLDSAKAGSGTAFDWDLIRAVKRDYFLAGGLYPENVGAAIRLLHPYGVDVSSGIETEGRKEREKMAAFVAVVRKEERL